MCLCWVFVAVYLLSSFGAGASVQCVCLVAEASLLVERRLQVCGSGAVVPRP